MGVVGTSQTPLQSDTPLSSSSTPTVSTRKKGLVRTSVVRLKPGKKQEEQLKLLCSISAKLWNEVTYARRQQFFTNKVVDLLGTYKEFYEKYSKLIGPDTAQAILNKNNQAWRDFFRELKKKKDGELPSFIKRINPPGYKKKNKTRVLWAVVKNRQYKVTENKIIIKGLGAIERIEVEYMGLVHLKGKQGQLEIRYDPDTKSWYAHISFEVEKKAVRGIWRKVPQTLKGDLKAGIDLGVNNLMAIYIEDGTSALVNGRPLKSIVHYVREKVSSYQSKINKLGIYTTRKRRLLYEKRKRQAKSFINTQVRRVVEWLYEKSVSTVYVGYPKYIAQQKG